MPDRVRTTLLILAVLLLTTILPVQHAQSAETPLDTIQSLQKRYQNLQSLEFDFNQITQTNGRVKEGKGHAVFCRPPAKSAAAVSAGKGVIRWNYSEPKTQIIINDGKEISIYTPEDKQLIITPARNLESDFTYALFTGTRSLADEFDVSEPDNLFSLSNNSETGKAVLLTPKQPQSQLKRVQLWLTEDLTISRLLMEDHFGSLTELSFSAVLFNALRGDNRQLQSLLKLDLVPGTETIRQ